MGLNRLVASCLLLILLAPSVGYWVLGQATCSPTVLYDRLVLRDLADQEQALYLGAGSSCVFVPQLRFEGAVPIIDTTRSEDLSVFSDKRDGAGSYVTSLGHVDSAQGLDFAAWLSWRCSQPHVSLRSSLLVPLLPPPEAA